MKPSVSLTIDRIAVSGVAPADRRTFARAFEEELAARLAEVDPARLSEIEGPIRIHSATESSGGRGRALARAIVEGMSR